MSECSGWFDVTLSICDCDCEVCDLDFGEKGNFDALQIILNVLKSYIFNKYFLINLIDINFYFVVVLKFRNRFVYSYSELNVYSKLT